MEVVGEQQQEGLPWELLYADDLIFMAESRDRTSWNFLQYLQRHKRESIFLKKEQTWAEQSSDISAVRMASWQWNTTSMKWTWWDGCVGRPKNPSSAGKWLQQRRVCALTEADNICWILPWRCASVQSGWSEDQSRTLADRDLPSLWTQRLEHDTCKFSNNVYVFFF